MPYCTTPFPLNAKLCTAPVTSALLTCSRSCATFAVDMETTLRQTTPQDWLAVKTLVQGVRRTMPNLWCWEEQLSDELFVVIERQRTIVGAFLACPDDSPVAWVRVAAIEDGMDVEPWLGLVVPATAEHLCQRGVQSLAWIDYRGWASPHLQAHGFHRLTDVITLAKDDGDLPERSAADVLLRVATAADIPAIAAVDHNAFTPHWWNSAAALHRHSAAAACFYVAAVQGQIVGYVEGELQRYSAHINRIAVAPERQAHGVGSALLEHALRIFWRAGADQVTLNTQCDNVASLRLYRRFGFEPIGSRVAVWDLPFRAAT